MNARHFNTSHLQGWGKMGEAKGPPFGTLRYLYIGTKNVERDLDYYTEVLGAEKVWDISSFGTRVVSVKKNNMVPALVCAERPIVPRLAGGF